MDTAQLLIKFVCPYVDPGNVEERIKVFSQSDECYKCPLLPVATIARNTNKTIDVQTHFPNIFQVQREGVEICKFKFHFAEAATYRLIVSELESENTTLCSDVQEITTDDGAFMPILYAFLVFLGLALIWIAGKWIVRKYRDVLRHFFSYQHFVHSDLGTPAVVNASGEQSPRSASPVSGSAPPADAKKKQRLRSLDTFRGISLVVMIFVNYGGGGYWFFRHSAWDGLTVADLLFPWFVWIMGAALAFGFRGPLQRGESRLWLFLKVFKRFVILFMFGLICNTTSCDPVKLSELRVLGVLQRLAISYLFVATLEIIFGKWGMKVPEWTNLTFARRIIIFFWDLIGSGFQWLFIIALVIVHTCLTFLLPFEGCPTGYLGPGGLAEGGKYYNCTGGAAQVIDRAILGPDHMYNWPTCKGLYKTNVPFDPEGVLGCLTSIAMCYLGFHAGRIFTLFQSPRGRVVRWLSWAVIWGLIAGILCNFSQFGGVIPVNKNLWSLSFIFSLSSMALVLLSLLYILCDVMHLWSGAPFVYPGMNSIVVYMSHELLSNSFPVKWAVDSVHWQVLAMNLWSISLFTIVAAIMYYQNVFIAI